MMDRISIRQDGDELYDIICRYHAYGTDKGENSPRVKLIYDVFSYESRLGRPSGDAECSPSEALVQAGIVGPPFGAAVSMQAMARAVSGWVAPLRSINPTHCYSLVLLCWDFGA